MKLGDIRALTYEVRVFGETVKVITVQTAKTVFEAFGSYKGTGITGKGGTRQGALNNWRHLAERHDD